MIQCVEISNSACTPLHMAVISGHLDTLKSLISDRNCDPDISGMYGRTPLHYAAECGHLHIVKYLTEEQEYEPVEHDPNSKGSITLD